MCADIDPGKCSNDIVPSQYEIDMDILDLCDDSHMMKFTHEGAQENLTDSLTSQLIEEGDPQNLSYASVSLLGIITSDLFLPLIFHLKSTSLPTSCCLFHF